MASATERLYASRRAVRRKQERIDTTTGVLDTVSQVLAFAGGQAKKAETAWGEYEAGYKELGGEGFEKPKFGQKGYFKGPKGDVMINKKMYDRSKIQKAGGFLGSDAASILSDEQRQQYLGRIAPGRTEATTFTKGISSQPLMSTGGKHGVKGIKERIETGTGGIGVTGQNYVTSDLASSRTGVYDQKGGIGFKADFLKGYQPNLQTVGDTITETDRIETERLQELSKFNLSKPTIADFRNPPKSLQQWSVGGIGAQDYLQPSKVTLGSQIPELNYPRHELSSEEVGAKKAQEQQWRLNRMPDPYRDQEMPYDEDSPGKMNWLDSYYENNRRRKKY